jgi:hypothetical protein
LQTKVVGQRLLLGTAPNEKLRGSECTRFAHGSLLFGVLGEVADALLNHGGDAGPVADLVEVETSLSCLL